MSSDSEMDDTIYESFEQNIINSLESKKNQLGNKDVISQNVIKKNKSEKTIQKGSNPNEDSPNKTSNILEKNKNLIITKNVSKSNESSFHSFEQTPRRKIMKKNKTDQFQANFFANDQILKFKEQPENYLEQESQFETNNIAIPTIAFKKKKNSQINQSILEQSQSQTRKRAFNVLKKRRSSKISTSKFFENIMGKKSTISNQIKKNLFKKNWSKAFNFKKKIKKSEEDFNENLNSKTPNRKEELKKIDDKFDSPNLNKILISVRSRL